MMQRATKRHARFLVWVMRHPSVEAWVTDDKFQVPEVAIMEALLDSPMHIFLVPARAKGFFYFHQVNAITWQAHVSFIREDVGAAVRLGLQAVAWMQEHTDARRLECRIPTNNDRAFYFAQKCGMRLEAMLKDSTSRDGRIMNEHFLGMALKRGK
jgi:RimJ/RimL family protein N-acetyltransferase